MLRREAKTNSYCAPKGALSSNGRSTNYKHFTPNGVTQARLFWAKPLSTNPSMMTSPETLSLAAYR